MTQIERYSIQSAAYSTMNSDFLQINSINDRVTVPPPHESLKRAHLPTSRTEQGHNNSVTTRRGMMHLFPQCSRSRRIKIWGARPLQTRASRHLSANAEEKKNKAFPSDEESGRKPLGEHGHGPGGRKYPLGAPARQYHRSARARVVHSTLRQISFTTHNRNPDFGELV
jgi:hypothetical protein